MSTVYFKSKKISLLILGVTALVCARAMFYFINDPEGTNLLVTTVIATIVYIVSLTVYLSGFHIKSISTHFPFVSRSGFMQLLIAIFIQILAVSFLLLLNALGF
jgi:hypothetical protein